MINNKLRDSNSLDTREPHEPRGEQPVLEGDGGLICKSHGLAVLMTHVNDGKPCADYLAGGTASTDHARAALVPVLMEALRQARRNMHHSGCSCIDCKSIDTALAAARKAGVE